MKTQSVSRLHCLGFLFVLLIAGTLSTSAALLHRYSFSEGGGTAVNDSVGTSHGVLKNAGNTGPVTNGGFITASLVLTNSGTNAAFVDLPNGLVSSMTNATFELWITWNGSANWQRIFDFGNSTGAEGVAGTGSNYVLLTAKSGNAGNPAVFGGRWYGLPIDMTVNATAFAPSNQVHAACTFDWSQRLARLYLNGQYAGSAPIVRGLNEIADVNNWLGRSQFSGDSAFVGSYNEFRIYDSALSAAQIATNYLAGPDALAGVPADATALRLIVTNISTFPNTVVSWRTQQVVVVADFPTATNVNVTVGEGATYSSSDTNVFTVDALGYVRAKNPGSATLTVNYQSVSDAKNITVVPQDVPILVHRYSFNDGAGTTVADSVGTAHATIINPTNTAWGAGKLSLSGGTAQQTVNGYIALPAGQISTLTNASFEAWVTMSNAPGWQRLFDFGSGTANYIFFAGQNPARLAYKLNNTVGENPIITTPGSFPQNALVHVVCTYNTASGQAKIFINGKLTRTGFPIYPLRSLGDANSWLGRAQFADPYWKGDYLEFRIYEGSMSEGDVALSYAAGPDTLPSTAGTLNSISMQVSNVMSGAIPQQQAVILANFQNVSAVDITTNTDLTFSCSNPDIVSCTSGGLLTALRPGTAIVTVTYRNFSVSQTITVLSTSHSLAHRYNFNEASGTTILDTVGTSHGTILGTNWYRAGGGVGINTATGGANITNTYIDLPNGIISTMSNATFEGWVTWNMTNVAWQRIFDFGSSSGGEGNAGTGTNSLFLCPKANNATGPMQINVNINPQPPAVVNWNRAFQGLAQTHFAVVYNKSLNTFSAYINGARVITTTSLLPPLNTMNDFNNWLGRSQYPDPYFCGIFQEFRIYTNALLDTEILSSYYLGPDAVLSAPSIANMPPKAVTPTTAFPAANLNTNRINSQVWLYWGTNDGGAVSANWSNVVDLGIQVPGQVYSKLSGLTAGLTYYYRFYATNAMGQSWAPATTSFITPAPYSLAFHSYTITNTFTGYTNAETLISFPALIVLNTNIPGFSYAQFLSPGAGDLRFVDGSGTELNYEIETWDTNGSSYVWVQVPEFTNGCSILINWGRGGLSIPAYSTNGATWADGFAGVWHMTNSLPMDSSRHGFDATFVNVPAAVAPTNGVIGVAQDYNAALGNPYTYVGTGLNFTNTTLSAWVLCRDANRQGLFMCKDGGAYTFGDFYLWQQAATLRYEIYNWGQDTVQQLANSGAAGNWVHLAVTMNGQLTAMYTNGILAATWIKANAPGQINHQFQLAGSVQTGRSHNGRLDECRAEYLPRSAAWIRACYLNQVSPASFQTASAIYNRPLPLTFGTPVVTNIDSTTAGFYVRAIGDGGNGIESWGTVWDTSANPNNNEIFYPGPSNAPMDVLLPFTGLTPGGHYFARAWASNAVEGKVYSQDAEFYTEPNPASGVTFSGISNSSMTISWTPGAGSASSLVVVRHGAAVAATPTDGLSYTANGQFGLGNNLGGGSYVVYAGNGTSATVTDLRRGSNYHVAVFSYSGSGPLANYQQDTPATGNQTTASSSLPEIADQLLIDIHNSRGVVTDAGGAVTEWINYGNVGGSFRPDGTSDTYPLYAIDAGLPCVRFDGGDRLRATFAAPKTITGVNGSSQPEDFSVEYWVYNPVVAEQEWIFNWARRGTSPRFAGVGYGTNNAYGVAAHWAAPDMAFGEGISTAGIVSTPPAGLWHHIVVTYDGSVERAYTNGVLNAQEGKALNLWDGDPVTLGWALSSALVYESTPFSGSIVGLRVHSKALTANQVANNFAVGPDGLMPAGPVRIAGQPANRTVSDGDTASFTTTAIGQDPISYQWYRNSALIPGATGSTYITPATSGADNGAQFFCIASNYDNATPYTATSSVATLTVISVGASLTHRWPFETDASDVVGGSHGTLMNGASINSGAALLSNPGSPASSANGQFVDLPNNLFMTYTSATFEVWVTDLGSGTWARIWDLGNSTGGEGLTGTGTNYTFITINSGAGGSLRGGIRIGTTGEQLVDYPARISPNVPHHIVWSQDGPGQSVRLYLDGVLVAQATSGFTITPASLGTAFNDWLGRSQFSGDAYFHGSIAEFRTYNIALPTSVVQRNYEMGPNLPPSDGPVSIWKNPTNSTVIENRPVTFVAGLNGHTPMSLQWFTNGVAYPGANGATFTFTPSIGDNGASIQLWATNNVGGTDYTASSTPVTLTVLPDTNPPVVLSVRNEGATSVLVMFSEMVAATNATNLASFSLAGPAGAVAISAASLDASGTVVTLSTDPLVTHSNYTLTVSGVYDVAGTPNLLLPNPTVILFTASPYLLRDVGSPSVAGLISGINGGYAITADGSGIGGGADQFTFATETKTGDFDVQVRVAALDNTDVWASAGLMARPTLNSNAQCVAVLTTPTLVGSFFQHRPVAGITAVSAGSFPANYPNGWLRLQRSGNVFTGYASYDGLTWTALGSTTLSLSNTLYVGLAVTSHATNQTEAQFLDIGNTASTTVGAVANASEPLGPSTRRTGLTITEIMYNPAPRTDGRIVEFVELFNSNPFFHDIGGHRLSGDIDYTFPPGTIIPAGAYIVIARNPADLQAVYGLSGVYGPYTGALAQTGTLRLRDEQNTLLLEISYENTAPWPVAADGAGHSLVLARPSYGEADPRAWDISDVAGGTPGGVECFRPSPLRSVVINEVLANAGPTPAEDYVELFNYSGASVDISGCVLTDNPTTNKFIIPSGTILAAGGFTNFTQTQLGFGLKSSGDTIWFKNPAGTRVLDAVRFGAQAQAVSLGRVPDGANSVFLQAAQTPGTTNSAALVNDIVINEIMYNPITKDDDDQFIELYNQGAGTVNLGGWKFVDAVNFSFVFPPGITIAPNSYVVVARNMTNLLAKYPALNSGNTVGNFSGRLAHSGERLALARPEFNVTTNTYGAPVTNTLYITVDEVTYADGGRWGQWSDGGGSSLELIDPRANHRLAANWADSDESAKAPWTTIQTTAVLDNGANHSTDLVAFAQIGQLDAGECLVDDIEVLPVAGTPNYIANPSFTTDLTGWALQGCFSRSELAVGQGFGGSGNALLLRASDSVFTLANSAQGTLNNTTLANGNTATLRFKARWLKGSSEILMRLAGNWLEASGSMTLPSNLGTPGAVNSRATNNGAPAIFAVTHNPPLPVAAESVVVSARVQDPDGVGSVMLQYRVEPAASYTSVAMLDNGTGGDALPGDGVFSATIPGQAASATAAFIVTATDATARTARFPALLNNNIPDRECVVRWGEPNPVSSFGTYHLWLTQSNVNRWMALPILSNEDMDGTLVYNNRVIYNASAHYAGSPYHQAFDGPAGSRACHYSWEVPKDDKLLGSASFNKIHWIGNDIQNDSATANVNDSTLQREQGSYTLLRGLGQPWVYRRYVAVYVNGSRRGNLMEDALRPSVSVPDDYFPNDTDGTLYKIQPWFEGGAAVNADKSWPWQNKSWAYYTPYTTTGGAYKQARYRWIFQPRQAPGSLNNYTNVYALMDAGRNFADPNWSAQMENVADMENWLRLVAANHAAGNWDCFGIQNGQNIYGYVGPQTRWTFFMFDFSISMGNPIAWAPGTNLEVTTADYWQYLYSAAQGRPVFRRMYWRALKELVNGAMTSSAFDPLADARYNAFRSSGINAASADAVKSWVASARSSIAAQIATRDFSAFTLATNLVNTSSNSALITGVAPLDVTEIMIDGVPWPVTWTSISNWSVLLPVPVGSNAFNVVAADRLGNTVGVTNEVSVVNDGTPASPLGSIVINEVMPNVADPDAEYIELFNTSTNTGFDLSGWTVNGLSYTFPTGSVLRAQSYLVLARSRTVFAYTYGATNLVFDTYDGNLQSDGETISLLQPGATTNDPAIIVDRVRYEAVAPWPVPVLGRSLQLIDAAQDNSRVGDWALALPTPGRLNATNAVLPEFPTLWLNEVQPENVSAPLDSFGDRDPWLEIFNPGTNAVSLDNLYLTDSYASLTQWPFPSNVVIGAGQFLVVWLDGESGESSLSELHTSFRIAPTNGSVAITRLVGGSPQVVDYLNYSLIHSNHTYGDVPDGQPFYRQAMFFPTPGASNNPVLPYAPLFVNEWLAQNGTVLPDPGNGNYEDWFEIYNPGNTPVSLEGFYLTDNPGNLTKYRVPAGYSVPAGGHLLVWADNTPAFNNTNTHPDLHVNFQLAAGGEVIYLTAPDGTNAIDRIVFGPQTANVSEGRSPDGCTNRVFFTSPTPRAANIYTQAPVLVCFDQTNALGSLCLAASALPDLATQFVAWAHCQSVIVTQAPLAGTVMTLGSNWVTVVARDTFGNASTCTALVVLTANAPVATAAKPASTRVNTAVTLDAARLLLRDPHPDGRPQSIVSIGACTNGGNASFDGTNIVYTPALNFSGTDGFSYTIQDCAGLSAAAPGWVVVTVQAASSSRQNLVATTYENIGGATNVYTIIAQGLPGLEYQLQRAETLDASAAWTNLMKTIAGGMGTTNAGQLIFKDTNDLPAIFYRTKHPAVP